MTRMRAMANLLSLPADRDYRVTPEQDAAIISDIASSLASEARDDGASAFRVRQIEADVSDFLRKMSPMFVRKGC